MNDWCDFRWVGNERTERNIWPLNCLLLNLISDYVHWRAFLFIIWSHSWALGCNRMKISRMNLHVRVVERHNVKSVKPQRNGFLSIFFLSTHKKVFFSNLCLLKTSSQRSFGIALRQSTVSGCNLMRCHIHFDHRLLSSFTRFRRAAVSSQPNTKLCLDIPNYAAIKLIVCDMCAWVICYSSHSMRITEPISPSAAASIILSLARSVSRTERERESFSFVESNHRTNCIHWCAGSG